MRDHAPPSRCAPWQRRRRTGRRCGTSRRPPHWSTSCTSKIATTSPGSATTRSADCADRGRRVDGRRSPIAIPAAVSTATPTARAAWARLIRIMTNRLQRGTRRRRSVRATAAPNRPVVLAPRERLPSCDRERRSRPHRRDRRAETDVHTGQRAGGREGRGGWAASTSSATAATSRTRTASTAPTRSPRSAPSGATLEPGTETDVGGHGRRARHAEARHRQARVRHDPRPRRRGAAVRLEGRRRRRRVRRRQGSSTSATGSASPAP